MKKKISLTLLLLIIFAGVFYFLRQTSNSIAQTYTIRPEHPRMWVTANTIPDLRTRKSQAGISTHYNYIMSYITAVKSASGTSSRGYYGDSDAALMSAFLYLSDGDVLRANDAAVWLGYVADDVLDTTHFNNNPGNLFRVSANLMWRITFAYDWIYNRLSESQKNRIGQAIVKLANIEMNAYRHSDYNNHYENFILPPIVFAGIALYNNGYQNNEAIGFLNYAETNIEQHTLLAIEQVGHNGGGWHEAPSYTAQTLLPFSLMLEAWNTATGKNLFTEVPALGDLAKWWIYITRPYDNKFERIADMNEFFTWIFAENAGYSSVGYIHGAALPLLANKYNEGYTQWAAEQSKLLYMPTGGSGGRNVWHIPWVIWYNPNISAKAPNNSLPLSKHFEGLGWVVMRTGFESINDTFALFKSGNYYNSHQHCDNNSFVIQKKGSLAIDSGSYEWTSHRENYYTRTIAHNSITVYKPGEILYDEYGPYSNDGGQFWHGSDRRQNYTTATTGLYKGNTHYYDKGKIEKYEDTTGYTYSVGDATNAYQNPLTNTNKVSLFEREFIFLKPDYFVIFDRINSTDASYTKKWLLHSVNEPILDGAETITKGIIHVGISESVNSSLAIINEGDGKLFSKTLLPEKTIIRKVGGSGYEFYVDGTNYPISGASDPENGAWRIEVEPSGSDIKKDNLFLHVLYAADSSITEMPNTEKIETNSGEMIGAFIGRENIIIFNKAEGQVDTSSNIIYNLSGEGASKHLIADLKPNIEFTIINKNLDNNTQTIIDKTSSDQGTLYFETNLGSNHQIVISKKESIPIPSITLTLSADKNEIQSGDTLTYTLTYQNTTSASARNIVITNPIPQGVTYVAGSATNGGVYDAENNRITWTIPALSGNATGAVSFRVTVE